MKITDKELTTVCKPVEFDKPKQNLDLAHKLLRLMRKENGMGLAANQCGLDIRLFVMCVDDVVYHCFNPEILEYSSTQVEMEEGCLSYPGQFCKISRPEKILVKYYSASGMPTQEWLESWAARCFQHELDHLNAITMHIRFDNDNLII